MEVLVNVGLTWLMDLVSQVSELTYWPRDSCFNANKESILRVIDLSFIQRQKVSK